MKRPAVDEKWLTLNVKTAAVVADSVRGIEMLHRRLHMGGQNAVFQDAADQAGAAGQLQ
jgi:hypothetical protein